MLVWGSPRIKIDQINRHPDFLNFTSTKVIYYFKVRNLGISVILWFNYEQMYINVSFSKLLESMV